MKNTVFNMHSVRVGQLLRNKIVISRVWGKRRNRHTHRGTDARINRLGSGWWWGGEGWGGLFGGFVRGDGGGRGGGEEERGERGRTIELSGL